MKAYDLLISPLRWRAPGGLSWAMDMVNQEMSKDGKKRLRPYGSHHHQQQQR